MAIEKDFRFTKQGKILTIVGLCLVLFGLLSLWTSYYIVTSDVLFWAAIIGFLLALIGLILWTGGENVIPIS